MTREVLTLTSAHPSVYRHASFCSIALDCEVFRETRQRSNSVGFGERDSMPDEKTLPHTKRVVLAKHYPTIILSSHSLRHKAGREPQ